MKSVQKQLSAFTMVEILLALGVCAIGICSVMVLFPIGANASRDAAMETYAANAADQMLNYLKYEITLNYEDPLDKNKKWVDYILGSTILETENPAKKDPPPEPPPYDLFSTDVWPTSMGAVANNVFKHQTNKGVYQIISCRNSTPDVDSTEIDFRAIMNVWRQPIQITAAATPLDYKMAVQLNVEVSWPAALPYTARQKSHYVLEVFNPNFTP